MIAASCHCGAVALKIQSAPTEVTDCNCSICRRYGVLWAYYTVQQVAVTVAGGAADTYCWGEKHTQFNRCARCGCVTHWSATDPLRDRMAVNARLLAPEVLARAKVRHLDGADSFEYTD